MVARRASLRTIVVVPLLMFGGCGRDGAADAPSPGNNLADAAANEAGTAPANAAPADNARWDLQSSGEGTALVLARADGEGARIRLLCPARSTRLLVNVPEFRPIGSEERLSFGSGGNVMALVAETRGDRQRGGVSGTGDVPPDLARLIAGPVLASYGAQRVGPLPAPPPQQARAFVLACGETGEPPPAAPSPPAPARTGACWMQGSERLAHAPLRAVGTEPFWSARIEGRCVTYSHPEDLAGTRVWTRYAASPGGGTWTGALNGRPFLLRTRAAPGCSDGMSDERYPIAVTLTVNGEQRTGCARPS